MIFKKPYVVIPARRDSKRFPFKNRILIQKTIDQAIRLFGEVHISTDDEEICKLQNVYKGIYINQRSKKLSGDKVKTIDVLKSMINYFDYYDILICLQCTSPLRKDVDIIYSIIEFYRGGYDYLYTTHNGRPNGAVYIWKGEYLRKTPKNVGTYEMPMERSIDINTKEDYEIAELLKNVPETK